MVLFKCKVCKKEFSRKGIKQKTAKYCSFKCKGIAQKGVNPIQFKEYQEKFKKPENYLSCEECQKTFYSSPSEQRKNRRFCSIKCRNKNPYMGKAVLGEKHWNWKGGKNKLGEYVYILSKTHPRKNSGGYVAEHRLVMENKLKRYLTPNEEVHHRNGIKTDNRIENLELVIKKMHFGIVICPHCRKDFKVK